MTPSQQQAKDMQDEARREQQADDKVRELEAEIDRLRYALRKIKDLPPVDEIHAIAEDALDGGGDTDE